MARDMRGRPTNTMHRRLGIVSFALAALTSSVFACGGGDSGLATSTEGNSGGVHVNEDKSPDGASYDDAPARPDGQTPQDGGTLDDAEVDDASAPIVRFIGRFDTRDPAGPRCAWPGCRIVARFDGTTVRVRLNEQVAAWMEGGPSEWDVAIDGVWQPRLVLTPGIHDYDLGVGLVPGPHRVELYRRTEAQNGMTQFLGYDFAGGTLLPPPKPAAHRLEVVGDSAAAGFGIEGVGQGPDCPGPDWGARWQNFRIAFPQRLADTLSAELHGTVYSGKGLARNIWRADTETMPVIYGRALPIDPSSPFDLSSWVPDAVVVMIGGNDFAIGQPVDDGPLALADFTQAYRGLVDKIRARAPNAHLFLATSPSVTDLEPPDRASRTNVMAAIDTVVGERNGAGDARVYAAAPALAPASELTACNGHGTPAFHDRVAAELAAVIKAKTGW